ncbi:MAG: hypothetical protein AAGA20_13725 [Planctomycetota bacterium]
MWIATLCLAALPQSPHTEDLSRAAPERTIFWLQTTELAPVLDEGLDHPLVRRVLDHPLVREDLQAKGQHPEAALAFVEALIGESPLELAAALSRRGVGVGLLPGSETEPRAFVAMRGANLDSMEEAIDVIAAAAATFGGLEALPEAARKELGPRVRSAWSIDDDGAEAALSEDGTLFLAARHDDLREATTGSGRAIELRAARRALGQGSTFAWVDLDAFEETGALDELRQAVEEPATHFVFGPVVAYGTAAGSLAIGVEFGESGLTVRSLASGEVDEFGAATFPSEKGSAARLPLPSDDEVARAVLHRDVATLLAQRTSLFPPRSQPAISEGLANFALLVGGPDAVDELFASLEPEIVLLAEHVPFEAKAVPDIELPAACIVARLRNPEVNGPRVVGAFQSLIALQNVQRAQEGKPGLVLGLAPLEGTTMTTAHLPPPSEGDGVDLAYNVAPGCAVVGDSVVLATHHALASRVATRIARGETGAASGGAVDQLWMRADAVEALVAENRDLIELQSVLEDGKTEARARMEVDLLLELLGSIGTIEMTTSGGSGSPLEARLRIEWAQ